MRLNFLVIVFFFALFALFSVFNLDVIKQNQEISLIVVKKNLPPFVLVLGTIIVSWVFLLASSSIGKFYTTRDAAMQIRRLEAEIQEKEKIILQLKASAFDDNDDKTKEFREFVLNGLEEVRNRISSLEQEKKEEPE